MLLLFYLVITDAYAALGLNLVDTSVSIAEEICDNGIDDDGDGLIDSDDPDCCAIQIEYVCDDEGTSGDPTDDTFTTFLTITNASGSQTYEVGGDMNYEDASYDEQIPLAEEFSVFGNDLVLELNDATTKGCSTETFYAPPPSSCSNCVISIQSFNIGSCINNQYQVEIVVQYQDLPTDQIEINGQLFSIADPSATANAPAIETFILSNLACPQDIPLSITAQVRDDSSCGDTVIITPPNICSITIDNVEIYDCVLDITHAEITFTYQNAAGNILLNECNIMPTSNMGTETFLLRNLDCATDQDQLIRIQFQNDLQCQAEATITPPCPKPSICLPIR